MSVTGSRFMNLVRFKGLPILRQLHIEEQLLRTSSDNWCIVNDGTNDPTIVMGVSGVPRELLEIGPVLRDEIPVIRRFTGGGTVVVDSGTVFVTLICSKDAVAGLQPYPRPIMSWSGHLYARVFQGVGDFNLRENGISSHLPSNPNEFVISVLSSKAFFLKCVRDLHLKPHAWLEKESRP
ncbi:hypothetical protein FNV43_RR20910 [Rhamnella rubrinervis]|uniref:BPL/LPL catalytic domain-containing protein n=1 Tax=Rhamnella rubrinervis TaxID=2594499 RepID=A0A8K0E224_9ROSA|nr:hypothetical protein FNV43_RR20910 [Rhamnella rubrinervis]